MLEAFLVTMLINAQQPGLGLDERAQVGLYPTSVDSAVEQNDVATSELKPGPENASPAPEVVEVITAKAKQQQLIILEDGVWDFSAKQPVRSAPQYPQWGWFKQHSRRLVLQDRLWNPTGKPPLFQDWSPF